MCGNCKAAGPEFWICSQCNTRNAVRFNIDCSKCRHPLITNSINGVVIQPKPKYQQGMPPRQ